MHAHLTMFAGALAVFAGAAVSLGQQPVTRDAATPAPAGTARLAGHVTRLDTGTPVRRARLTLAAGGSRQSHQAMTDDAGRFSFEGLAADSYTLTARRAGLLHTIYGQEQPGSGRPGTVIDLREGQRLENLKIGMPRGGVITGLITDEAGEPVYGASVRALRRVRRDGTPALVSGASAQSDDRGLYRLPLLAPGDYVVMAEWREPDAPDVTREVMAARMAEMTATAGRSNNPAMAAEAQAMVARLAEAMPAEAPDGYALIYYPGTPLGSNAEAVTVGIAAEMAGIDVQLQRVPLASISGTVLGIDPAATVTTTMQLIDHQQAPGLGRRRINVRPDGQFTIGHLPPGRYGLTVVVAPPVAGLPAGASRSFSEGFALGAAAAPGGARGVADLPQTLWGTVDVTLSGQSLTDVAIGLSPGTTISGSVTFEGGTSPADRGRLAVALVPTGAPEEIEHLPLVRPAVVDDSGRFVIRGVLPGRYRVTPALGVPGFAARSAIFGGVDALDFPIDVRAGEDIAGGTLTLSTRMAELSGAVRTRDATPETNVTIVVFADDSRYWLPQARRIVAARPSSEGRFRFANLAPGRYRLAAVIDPEPGQWFDPDFLRTLAGGSIAVELAEGDRHVQDLQVGR